MAELDRAFLRKLAEWDAGNVPVTTVYLSVDGRQYPRRQDYEVRLDELLRKVRAEAERIEDRDIRCSVAQDADAMSSLVRERFDRGPTRGLALFSASAAGLWEDVAAPRPFRDLAAVGPHPDLLSLEALLEVYETFCTVLVDSSRARIFRAELGRIEEESDIADDVPGRHDQGGWSQARYQRHIDDHRQRHLRHTAEVLFRFSKRRPFDHLILGGPDEVVAEFERDLHDYLKRKILARVHLPLTAPAAEVLQKSVALEEELERKREQEAVGRLLADAAAGRPATTDLPSTLEALAAGKVGSLLVSMDLSAPGHECTRCGRLSERGGACRSCRGRTRPVPDVVEAAVAQAYRGGCRVEIVTSDGAFAEVGGIGALLRF